MTRTAENRYARALSIAVSLLLAAGVTGVAAQDDESWLPFLGCWQPSGSVEDVESEDTRAYVVCVTAAEGGARFETIADGETVAERLVVANGEQRAVDQAGCTGWETAEWSADGQRVYLRSELECEGGVTRETTGVLTVASPHVWLDIQGVAVGANDVIRTRRYRTASQDRIQAAGARPLAEDRTLAVATARTAAAEPLALGDVEEASGIVSADVLGALLIERESEIRLSADALRSLADANVPESVIDLMVALDNPETFAIDRGAMTGVERPEEPREQGETRYGNQVYLDYDPFWYGYGRRYGYGYGSAYGYGNYGYGNGYWYRPPQIIIVQPEPGDPAPRGRYVKGRGYVPSNPPSSSGSSATRDRSGSSSGTASSGSSSRGSNPPSSSGSSTGRTAKKKGGGGS